MRKFVKALALVVIGVAMVGCQGTRNDLISPMSNNGKDPVVAPNNEYWDVSGHVYLNGNPYSNDPITIIAYTDYAGVLYFYLTTDSNGYYHLSNYELPPDRRIFSNGTDSIVVISRCPDNRKEVRYRPDEGGYSVVNFYYYGTYHSCMPSLE